MTKNLPIPNVVGEAKIQIIDGTKWKTLKACWDTPNAIKAAVKSLRDRGHRNLWVRGCLGARKPMF